MLQLFTVKKKNATEENPEGKIIKIEPSGYKPNIHEYLSYRIVVVKEEEYLKFRNDWIKCLPLFYDFKNKCIIKKDL